MSAKLATPSLLKVFPYSTVGIIAILLVFKYDTVDDMLEITSNYFEIDRTATIAVVVACVILLMLIAQCIWSAYYYYKNRQLAIKEAQQVYEKERNALVALFNALDGKQWKDKTRWCSDEPIEKWKGVKVDRDTGRVNKLLLAENQLAGNSALGDGVRSADATITGVSMWVVGYIPEEIGELECLKEIDFRLNKIKGTTLLSFLLTMAPYCAG
jgi:hypothetical protein